jgi:hypothetical protein
MKRKTPDHTERLVPPNRRHETTHPVLVTFCRLLLVHTAAEHVSEVDEGSGARLALSALEDPTSSSGLSSYQAATSEGPGGSGTSDPWEVRDDGTQARRRRARIRWWLAITLHNNTALVTLRKRGLCSSLCTFCCSHSLLHRSQCPDLRAGNCLRGCGAASRSPQNCDRTADQSDCHERRHAWWGSPDHLVLHLRKLVTQPNESKTILIKACVLLHVKFHQRRRPPRPTETKRGQTERSRPGCLSAWKGCCRGCEKGGVCCKAEGAACRCAGISACCRRHWGKRAWLRE